MNQRFSRWSLIMLASGAVLAFSGSQAVASDLLKGWTGEIFAGYDKTSGNTDKGSGTLTAQAVKKIGKGDVTLKSNVFYSESDKKMDGQKWDGLAKYSFDFGQEKRTYNYYQIFVDHDYFADIDYRITPGAGLGYHLSQTEEWTWDVDGGIGYRITRHRINEDADDEEPTALLHTFMKKKFLANAFVSEDLTASPGLKGNGDFLLKSTSALTNPISEKLDMELKYIVDYNAQPAEDKKKTDTQFVAGLKYKF